MEIYNNIRPTSQTIYDCYNGLIFSDDTRVFNKMVKKIELYNVVKSIPGDIVEFGVFKGAGIALFLKLKRLNEPNSIMKVIGFDYFQPNNLLCTLDGLNKEMMQCILDRVEPNDLLIENVEERLSCFNKEDYFLIQGNAVDESKKYYEENVGARIKLLYMDLDLGDPTYNILKNIWCKVVKGGVVVFDEYGYHKWDESNGVDKFLSEIEGQYELIDTKIFAPTLYILKK